MTDRMVQSRLDQSQTSGGVDSHVHTDVIYAQTFTAGLTGNLVGVDLHLRLVDQQATPEAPLVVEIQTVLAGQPTGRVLATASIAPGEVTVSPEWVTVGLDPPPASSADTQYAIVASALGVTDANSYVWDSADGELYPRGQGLVRDPGPGEPLWRSLELDTTFQTYVALGPAGGPPDPDDE
jgi:hypothetical protein